MLIPLLGLYQGANDHYIVKMLINVFRALGQMFDKLNSAEQVEGAESVVKVSEQIKLRHFFFYSRTHAINFLK